jgi:hypothetical protein
MRQNRPLHRRVPHRALVMLERSAGKLARSVLRGERSREAPDLPGAFMMWGIATTDEIKDLRPSFIAGIY